MQANIIEYELLDRIAGEEGFIWQYDRGQKLKFKNIELPFSYEVHFANKSSGSSLKVLGDSSGVVIPYDVTKTGKPVYLWLYVATSESAAQTVYGNTVSVRLRAEIATETPTPEQHGVIEQTISALNDGISEVRGIAEGIPEAIDTALAQAKASGEFKGDPGAVFTPSINDGVMSWSNNGDLQNPDPVDLRSVFDLSNYATKQELSGKIDTAQIGSANGVAGLDASGRVPSEQLPSYVDDVLEFASLSMFPMPGESGKIYISLSNNHQYRWTGTQYIDITSGDLETRKADKRDTVLETTLSRGRVAGSNVGAASIAFGSNNAASGEVSQAFGSGTNASGFASHAEGTGTTASGSNSHAEGNNTRANGAMSHAEGLGGSFTRNGTTYQSGAGNYAHSEGDVTVASGDGAHSEGFQTLALGGFSHAEGSVTIASANQAHAEGAGTIASGTNAHAEGIGGTFTINDITYTSGASGTNSHTEGNKTLASYDAAHAEGYETRSTGTASHAEGGVTLASAQYAHAEGYNTVASGYSGSHAEGANTTASDDSAHAEGDGTTASNNAAHAEGSATEASGEFSHSEGANTTASGGKAHAEGYDTTASGDISHAEGSGSTASGDISHAEGSGSTASGDYSHAEGASTIASGNFSHAEGAGTRATNSYAHAEGAGSQATGQYAHAEGASTQANAYASHSEGSGAQANGSYAHAEGGGTQANGYASHSEGEETVASGKNSHVGGMYNVTDSYANWTEWTPGEHCVPGDKRKRTRLVDEQTVVEGYICKTENTDSGWTASHWIDQAGKMNYAEIVGNGTGNDAKSNARALDWEGNAFFKGDVYVGCNPDSTGGTKLEPVTYMTLADAQAIIDGYGVSA